MFEVNFRAFRVILYAHRSGDLSREDAVAMLHQIVRRNYYLGKTEAYREQRKSATFSKATLQPMSDSVA